MRVPADQLRRQVAAILVGAGMRKPDAADCADVLVQADARGFEGNGVMQVPTYVKHLLDGELCAGARISRRSQAGMLIVDGGGGLGHVVARRAVRWAVSAASRRGVVAAVTHSHGYTGVLGVHVREAAHQGLMALYLQTTHPFLTIPGAGSRLMIGNNPIAFAAPVAGEAPLVFDMACSVSSLGRIRVAAAAGEPIPPGWAVDDEGMPTTDAAAALIGGLLPVGDHKGLGLAILVECLAGGLVATPRRPQQVSGFLLVVNPELVPGAEAFAARMQDWLRLYRSGGSEARLPGRRAELLEAERERDGIPVPPVVLEQLEAACDLVGARYSLQY